METLTEKNRATIEFKLSWQSGDAVHTDCMRANRVSLWRDCLPGELCAHLAGLREGESATEVVTPDVFPQPFSPAKIVRITQSQFAGNIAGGRMVIPAPGRFYPQGMLRGVPGVFPVSIGVCRFLGKEEGKLVFDLNHPLSNTTLHLKAYVYSIEKQRVERGGRCEDWLEATTANGPGMQARYRRKPTEFFSREGFRRENDDADHFFYHQPRLIHHLDRTAEETVTRLYGEIVQPKMTVLDLMGSWASHLPDEPEVAKLTVLGMNREELTANRKATNIIVHDLNKDPALPLTDASYDAVLCTVSIEYLTNPLAVFREAARVLRKNGILAISFSNRWFPAKAISLWKDLHDFERMGFVLELFYASGSFYGLQTFSQRGLPRPEDDPHGELPFSDPVFLVSGRKR